jgi:Asp-tRNA(Asn)/Glu-tRNA(Gln) amidotransferase A subunit family amidase
MLWRNAQFDKLKDIKELDDYEPRHDPTVIPIVSSSDSQAVSIEQLPPPKPRANTHQHYTSADYVSSYKSGKLTPSDVAEVLIPLISRDVEGEHSVAFLESKADLVRAAAQASTTRYQEGKSLGPLDGVPVAVKDEVDLKGYKRTLGSTMDFTNKDDETAWCVKQWEDAGAIVIGKTNMHEIGLGMSLLALKNSITRTPLPPTYSPLHLPS